MKYLYCTLVGVYLGFNFCILLDKDTENKELQERIDYKIENAMLNSLLNQCRKLK
jgi:hypothetical protein